ncbi:MAG: hypothetical protein AB1715_13150 [Acidobacteriota bacterium]
MEAGEDSIRRRLREPEKIAPGVDMRAYDHLSDEQRLQIAEFIVSLKIHQDEK